MRKKENRFQCLTVATQHNRMNCSLYLPTPTQPRQGRGSAQEPPCAREIFCVHSCVQGHCICKLDPKGGIRVRGAGWRQRLREARKWAHLHCGRKGRTTVASLEYMRPAGPLGPGQNHGRLSHEIAVAEDVLDDKRCLTASWYENVAHAWSSGSCWKGRGPLQYTCRSSRSMSNMSSQLAVSEQSNSLNCWWLHMYSMWGLNPRPMAYKTIALTTELRELLTTS